MEEEILYRVKANCPHLTQLDLSNKNLDISNIKMLTHFLKKNTNLTSLNLEGNRITNKGALLIDDMLKDNSTLVELNLVNTQIKNEGERALGKRVTERKELQISLIKNFIVTGCYDETIYHMIKP